MGFGRADGRAFRVNGVGLGWIAQGLGLAGCTSSVRRFLASQI